MLFSQVTSLNNLHAGFQDNAQLQAAGQAGSFWRIGISFSTANSIGAFDSVEAATDHRQAAIEALWGFCSTRSDPPNLVLLVKGELLAKTIF